MSPLTYAEMRHVRDVVRNYAWKILLAERFHSYAEHLDRTESMRRKARP